MVKWIILAMLHETEFYQDQTFYRASLGKFLVDEEQKGTMLKVASLFYNTVVRITIPCWWML